MKLSLPGLGAIKTIGLLFTAAKAATWFGWAVPVIGPLVSVAGSLVTGAVSALAWFIRWTLADFDDALKAPQKIVVRCLCFALLFAGGLWVGADKQFAKDQ